MHKPHDLFVPEVQICIHYVGICGTDIHFWKNGEMSGFKVTKPVVPGHEPSGVISKLGEGVTDLKVGESNNTIAVLFQENCKILNSSPDLLQPHTQFNMYFGHLVEKN